MRPIVAVLLSVCGPAIAQDIHSEAPRRPVAVLEEACSACHGLNHIEVEKTREEWEYTVNNMIGRGAKVRPEEIAGLVAYLNKYHGMPVNLNKASAEEIQSELQIPAEDARAIVKARQTSALKGWPDLEKIEGLNIKKLEPVRDRIMFQ
jgi:hypothetical protein